MREIKFRAWDKKNKKWIFIRYLNPREEETEYLEIEDMEGEIYGEEEVELMQFTGLKDKNGKEIFEGDIIKNNSFEYIGVVEFSLNSVGFVLHKIKDKSILNGVYLYNANVEVIGNIYENPKLCGGVKQ